jgi:hypothetical protein
MRRHPDELFHELTRQESSKILEGHFKPYRVHILSNAQKVSVISNRWTHKRKKRHSVYSGDLIRTMRIVHPPHNKTAPTTSLLPASPHAHDPIHRTWGRHRNNRSG